MPHPLLSSVKTDIESFLVRGDNELFFNEGDLQMHLAIYLRLTSHYDDVDLEYFIPQGELPGYIWPSQLYIDIVVRKGDSYVPVELKYPTARVTRSITRFGENMPEEVEIVKSHGAYDFVLYNFWKDVRRLELVCRRFPRVVGGLALLLTNDTGYMRPRRKGTICEQMSVSEDIEPTTSRHWLRTPGGTVKNGVQTKPDFDLDKPYPVKWRDAAPLEGVPFKYCILEI